MLSVIVLKVVMLNVVILSVVMPFLYCSILPELRQSEQSLYFDICDFMFFIYFVPPPPNVLKLSIVAIYEYW